jgi:hypothetical protein
MGSFENAENAGSKHTVLPIENTNRFTQPEAPLQILGENQHPASQIRATGILDDSQGKSMETPGNVLRAVSSLPNVKRPKVANSPHRYCATPQVQCENVASEERRLNKESPRPLSLSNANSVPESPAKSTPGLSAAVTRQFGTVSTGSPRRRSTRFQTMNRQAGGELPNQRSATCETSDAQVMGSKRMVELFLSSRRNRIAGNASERSVSGSSAAFI